MRTKGEVQRKTRYVIHTLEGTRINFSCLSTAMQAAHRMADDFGHDVRVMTPVWGHTVYVAKTRFRRREKRFEVEGRRFYRLDFAVMYAKKLCAQEGRRTVNVTRLHWECGRVRFQKTEVVVVAREVRTYVPTAVLPNDSMEFGQHVMDRHVLKY